jgi:outer membrane protein OmpA-like peptidoglycan-associated protein
MLAERYLLHLIFLIVCNTTFCQIPANYKSFPLKRFEFADGRQVWGYYDELNKNLYPCKGNKPIKIVGNAKSYDDKYCCLSSAVAYIAKSIKFSTGGLALTNNSEKGLDSLSIMLNDIADVKVNIEVHTDNLGPDDKNLALSQERAGIIKAFLVKKGIEDKRIYSIGLGESKPIASNKTAAGRTQNRRVVIELTSFDAKN